MTLEKRLKGSDQREGKATGCHSVEDFQHLTRIDSEVSSKLPLIPRGKHRAMVAEAFVTRAIVLLLIVPLLSVLQATHDSACSDGDGSLLSLGFVLNV